MSSHDQHYNTYNKTENNISWGGDRNEGGGGGRGEGEGGGPGGRDPGRQGGGGPIGFFHAEQQQQQQKKKKQPCNVHHFNNTEKRRRYDGSNNGGKGRNIKRHYWNGEDPHIGQQQVGRPSSQQTTGSPHQHQHQHHWMKDENHGEWNHETLHGNPHHPNSFYQNQEAPIRIAAPTVPRHHHRPLIKQEETVLAAAPPVAIATATTTATAAAAAADAPILVEDVPHNSPQIGRMESVPIKQEEIPMSNQPDVISLLDDDDDDDDDKEDDRTVRDQGPKHAQVEYHSQEALDTLRQSWIDDRTLSIAGRLEQFSQLSYRDQVMMLLPESIPFEQLPPLRKVQYSKSTVREIANIVKEQMQREADPQTHQKNNKNHRRYEEQEGDENTSHASSSGSADDQWYHHHHHEDDANPSVRAYMDMLSICHPMTLGFRVEFASAQSNNHWCYCPCDRRMTKWRELCGLTNIVRCCTSKGKMSPSPLLQHLRDYGRQDVLHQMTLLYLKELFRHYLGYDLGHVDLLALENPSQHKRLQEKRIRQAMDAEMNEDIRKKKQLEEDLKILELVRTNDPIQLIFGWRIV
jgi:hypothetical protein